MKNKINIYISILLVGLLGALTLSSCSDWTDQEPIDLKYPLISDKDPVLYAEYLENLRAYKKSEHKVVYAWFDNSVKTPTSRAHHYTSLPDSIDYVVIENSQNLVKWELDEIEKIRQEKGIKTLNYFSYNSFRAKHDANNMENDIEFDLEHFVQLLLKEIYQKLELIRFYNLDGFVFEYKGMLEDHMTEAEKKQTAYIRKSIFPLMKVWKKENPNLFYTFSGYPNYVYDEEFLNNSQHIILPTANVKNISGLDFEYIMALGEGMPMDRFVVVADMPSLDETDTKTGYFADGSYATENVANWSLKDFPEGEIVGLGIYGVANDYYGGVTYNLTRRCINIINPSY